MNAIGLLGDLSLRPLEAVLAHRGRLTQATLNAHLGGHDNSPAWLLWHMGREIDAQVADLTEAEELWFRAGYRERFALGDDSVGYGHTSEEARAIVVDDLDLLLDYLEAATRSLVRYASELSTADLDAVIDERWDPPVTRGVRLVSIISDAAQHAGQLGYALGLRAGHTGS